MAKNKVELGVNQTRGTFVMKGKITGRTSNNFFTEGTSQNGKAWRRVRFGVEIEPNKTIYCDLFGTVNDFCYASRTTKGADGKNKTETQQIPWGNRFDLNKNEKFRGYRIIGVTCGVKKKIDPKNGNEVNDVKYLTTYDACDEVGNLSDGDSVFIRGNIVYSTYNEKHRISFEPQQISLCKPIDFDDLEYKADAHFTQNLVLMGIAKNENSAGEAIVNAKIVNYSTIEDAELFTRSAPLAKNFNKLKEYTFIKVWGDIDVETGFEEVTTSDGWGASNTMERITSPSKRKLVITGADPNTIDVEEYSQDKIEHALEVIANIQSAKNDFGKKDDNGWGNKNSNFDEDESDDFDLGLG